MLKPTTFRSLITAYYHLPALPVLVLRWVCRNRTKEFCRIGFVEAASSSIEQHVPESLIQSLSLTDVHPDHVSCRFMLGEV